MFGLADNDIVGAKTDVDRPIPSGEITLLKARLASLICLVVSFSIAVFLSFPILWYLAVLLLTVSILVYNRLKHPLFMGFCRGLGVVSGMCASVKMQSMEPSLVLPVLIVVLGWTFYIFGVTKLSEGEETDSSGLGVKRFFWGVSSLVPILAFLFCPKTDEFIIPVAGCCFTYVSWCLSVAPLENKHSSNERKRAVGQVISALVYMQIGFMFVGRLPVFIAASCVLWLATRFIRKALPSISGS
jgi:hypothetical protein